MRGLPEGALLAGGADQWTVETELLALVVDRLTVIASEFKLAGKPKPLPRPGSRRAAAPTRPQTSGGVSHAVSVMAAAAGRGRAIVSKPDAA